MHSTGSREGQGNYVVQKSSEGPQLAQEGEELEASF